MKKHTRIAAFAIALCICAVSAAGCGDKKTADNSSYDKAEKTTTAAVTEEAAEEITTEAATVAAPTELSDKYADLDNRSFKYNGHLLTLGVSTLQDVLDAGAQLDETDGSHGHEGFNFDIKYDDTFEGDVFYDTFQYKIKDTGVELSFANLTEQPLALRECILLCVNASLFHDIPDECKFSFDLSLTAEELLANSGEPTYVDEKSYETEYGYKVVSEKYPEYDSGYIISFDDDGKLEYVDMTIIPE